MAVRPGVVVSSSSVNSGAVFVADLVAPIGVASTAEAVLLPPRRVLVGDACPQVLVGVVRATV